MKVLGNGVYDLTEAAFFTGLRRRRIKEWFEGPDGETNRRPVFQSDYGFAGGQLAISFLDLVEVFVAGQLRDAGVSLQYIRRAHSRLMARWGIKHPFSRRDIRTDGKVLFECMPDDPETTIVHDVMTRNRVFEKIILPVLTKVDYARATAMAERWHIADMVVLDPEYCFGKPIVEPVNITTRVLADFYYANNQNVRKVANWYEIEEKHVLAAVAFESRKAA